MNMNVDILTKEIEAIKRNKNLGEPEKQILIRIAKDQLCPHFSKKDLKRYKKLLDNVDKLEKWELWNYWRKQDGKFLTHIYTKWAHVSKEYQDKVYNVVIRGLTPQTGDTVLFTKEYGEKETRIPKGSTGTVIKIYKGKHKLIYDVCIEGKTIRIFSDTYLISIDGKW